MCNLPIRLYALVLVNTVMCIAINNVYHEKFINVGPPLGLTNVRKKGIPFHATKNRNILSDAVPTPWKRNQQSLYSK
jgi:hypothetical protein